MILVLNSVRWVLIVFLIYVAALMKKEQEGEWENALQTWLDKIYSQQEGSYAKITALARAVARVSEWLTEKLFGRKLLSLRFFTVSAYLGISSFFLMGLLSPSINGMLLKLHHAVHANPPMEATVPLSRWEYVFGLLQFVFYFIVGMFPALYGKNEKESPWVWRMWKYGLLIIVLRYAVSIFWVFRLRSAFIFVLFMTLLFGLNFLWDMLFITTTRWMLRIASNTRQLAGVLVAVVLDVVLGITIIIGPLIVALYVLARSSSGLIGLIGAGLLLGSTLKLIDFIIAFLVLILLSLIGIHAAVWFVLERPIYSCLRFKVISDKKFIKSIILGLIAVPQVGTVWAFFVALLKAI
jgi:hypothetical protein